MYLRLARSLHELRNHRECAESRGREREWRRASAFPNELCEPVRADSHHPHAAERLFLLSGSLALPFVFPYFRLFRPRLLSPALCLARFSRVRDDASWLCAERRWLWVGRHLYTSPLSFIKILLKYPLSFLCLLHGAVQRIPSGSKTLVQDNGRWVKEKKRRDTS